MTYIPLVGSEPTQGSVQAYDSDFLADTQNGVADLSLSITQIEFLRWVVPIRK
jgi:hypothetical protein